MAETKTTQVTLRLDPELHAKLKDLASDDRRSLHAEILVLIDEALEAREESDRGKIAA